VFCVTLLNIGTGAVQYAASYKINWFTDSTYARGYYESEVIPIPLNACLKNQSLAKALSNTQHKKPANLYKVTIYEEDGCNSPEITHVTFDYSGPEICVDLPGSRNFNYYTVRFYSAGCNPAGVCYHYADWCTNHSTSCAEKCEEGAQTRGASGECSHLWVLPDERWQSYQLEYVSE